MKKIKLLNISLFSSLILFTACADSQNKITKKNESPALSVYNIMGITEPILDRKVVNIKKELPIYTPINMPHDIEYISYKKYTPLKNYSPIKSYSPIKNSYRPTHDMNTINDIEGRAKSFLGVPYVWGATGPSKFDCSGFTQWVYRDSGINIPRVSRDQARVGEFISYNNLERGDMVFFDTKKKRTGRVSHVGIYLGAGNFIHASSAGKKVVIYNFNKKSFYKKRFLWGRRVTPNNSHYASN